MVLVDRVETVNTVADLGHKYASSHNSYSATPLEKPLSMPRYIHLYII